jgi:hypothetical protein
MILVQLHLLSMSHFVVWVIDVAMQETFLYDPLCSLTLPLPEVSELLTFGSRLRLTDRFAFSRLF